MGLMQKAAVVMVLSILSQIVCCHCMPRNHSKSQIKSNSNKINAQNVKLMRNKTLTAINNLKAIRFPNVEYPLESDIGEYYRFLNDYPVQCKPKEYTSNCSCQVQTNKKGTKYKRKFDRVAKTQSQITTSYTEYDPETRLFPEVEYPLSARDMWIPKCSSRLEDVKRNGKVETDKLVDRIESKNTGVSNNNPDYTYENLALNTLIKTLNTKKTQVTESSYESNYSNETILNNSYVFNSTKKSITDIVTTITNIGNTSNNSQRSIPEEDKCSQRDAHPQMLTTVDPDRPSTVVESTNQIFRNLSRQIEDTSTECSGITITPDSNLITNIFTAMDYYNNIQSMIPDTDYFDLTDVTTAAPVEYVTYPMSNSGLNNIMLDQPTTTAPNPILTTNPPSPVGSEPTLSNSYNDNSIFSSDRPQNFLENDQDNITKNWTLNPNDSYITDRLPKDSDDWVIYVDTEKTFPSQEKISDYTMIGDTYFDGFNCYLGERPQTSYVVNYTLLTTSDTHGDETNQSQEVPKYIPNNYPLLNVTNSVKAITETGNVDTSNSLISSYNSCPSSTWYRTQTENCQSRDDSTNTSVPKHVGDSWKPVNDTESKTRSVEGNEYKSVSTVIENNTSEEPISNPNDPMDQFLYFEDLSSTLQFEYIDDASASVTEIPYDLIM